MKKVISILMALLMVFTLFSCEDPKPVEYTISFEGADHEAVTVIEGSVYKVPDIPKNGYRISCIKNGDVELGVGASITINGDVTLTYEYTKVYVVSFRGVDKKSLVKDAGSKYELESLEGAANKNIVVDGKLNSEGKFYESRNVITVDKDTEVWYQDLAGYTFSNVDGTTTVDHYEGNATVLNIPAYTKERNKVTKIGESFAEFVADKITEVVVPSTVTDIDAQAFHVCTELTEVELPEGLLNLGSSAFLGCSKLKEIKLPSTLKNIKARAFWGCELIGNVLDDRLVNLETIGDEAFQDCKSMTKVVLPETLTSFGTTVFTGSGLRDLICKSDNVVISKLGLSNTLGDNGLNSLVLEREVLNKYTILNMDINKIEFVGTQEIKQGAIFGDNTINSITLPEGLTSMEGQSFACKGLSKITIPSTVTDMGDGVFLSCENLETINIKPNTKMDKWVDEGPMKWSNVVGRTVNVVLPK